MVCWILEFSLVKFMFIAMLDISGSNLYMGASLEKIPESHVRPYMESDIKAFMKHYMRNYAGIWYEIYDSLRDNFYKIRVLQARTQEIGLGRGGGAP